MNELIRRLAAKSVDMARQRVASASSEQELRLSAGRGSEDYGRSR